MKIQKFEIPCTLPGVNEYTKANRANPYKGAKTKREAEEVVMWAAKAAHLKPMRAPVHVNIIWVEPNMRRDKDNISGARKFILDALVKAGVIGDDNWKWIGGEKYSGQSDAFMVNHNNPRVIVELIQL